MLKLRYRLLLTLVVLVVHASPCQSQDEPLSPPVDLVALEQAFDDLDLLWGLQIQDSAAYAEAHNRCISVSRQSPDIELFPVSMPYDYKDRCVEFDAVTGTLHLLEQCKEFDGEINALLVESYQLSQKMLSQYYLHQFQEQAEKISAELQDISQQEPDSALADVIPDFVNTMMYMREVERDPLLVDVVHVIETRNLLNDTEILLELEEQIRQTLKNDISFGPGKYKLEDFSARGQEAITTFVNNLLKLKSQYPLQYPGQPLILRVKTVGFTDEVPVTSPSLIGALLEGVAPEDVPDSPGQRRLFLNRRLSEFRAGTVNDYAVEQLQLLNQEGSELLIEPETVGKGETWPTQDDVAPPYLKRDPRRRVCKISVTFRREPLPFLHKSSP